MLKNNLFMTSLVLGLVLSGCASSGVFNRKDGSQTKFESLAQYLNELKRTTLNVSCNDDRVGAVTAKYGGYTVYEFPKEIGEPYVKAIRSEFTDCALIVTSEIQFDLGVYEHGGWRGTTPEAFTIRGRSYGIPKPFNKRFLLPVLEDIYRECEKFKRRTKPWIECENSAFEKEHFRVTDIVVNPVSNIADFEFIVLGGLYAIDGNYFLWEYDLK